MALASVIGGDLFGSFVMVGWFHAGKTKDKNPGSIAPWRIQTKDAYELFFRKYFCPTLSTQCHYRHFPHLQNIAKGSILLSYLFTHTLTYV